MMTLAVNPNTNQVTSGGATYDAAGNLTYDGTTNYTFDEMNRMTQASGPYGTFGYSYSPGENKRMVVYGSSSNPQTLKMFLYAPNGKVLSQLAYQKNGSNWAPIAINALTNYLYLGGKALSYAESSVGSNASGTYWPYGSTNTNPTNGPSTFATYLGDWSTLYYADQRYYDYNWGRFLTADPSNQNIDPTVSGSYNRYAYVNGDPINGTDPRGLDNEYCFDDGYGPECFTFGDGDLISPGEFDVVYDQDGNIQSITNIKNQESVTVNGDDPDPVPTDPSDPSDSAASAMPGAAGNGNPYGGTWYRIPLVLGTNYCGPGGYGSTSTRIDNACEQHDACYEHAGASWIDNVFGTGGSATQAAINSCNRQLCRAINLPDPTSQEAGQAFFVGIPFGCIP
jgi:RHS repeat-associated protein